MREMANTVAVPSAEVTETVLEVVPAPAPMAPAPPPPHDLMRSLAAAIDGVEIELTASIVIGGEHQQRAIGGHRRIAVVVLSARFADHDSRELCASTTP